MSVLILPAVLMITAAPAGSPAFSAIQPATPPEGTQAPVLPPPQSKSKPAGNDPGAIIVTGRQRTPGDPLERVNADSYKLTRQVDEAVFRPVAVAYRRALPKPLRRGLHNILSNLREPVVFVNYLLQLKPGKAAETVGRFTLNSSIGVAGLFDVAKTKPFKLPFRPNGFADSLGYYGVKQGAFIYLPFIGPTTIRDFIGDNIDRLVLPLAIGYPFNNIIYGIPGTAVSVLDRRIEFDERLQRLRETEDPYAASRDFYLERRQAEIDELHGRHHELLLPENAPPRAAPPVDQPATTSDATVPDDAQVPATKLDAPKAGF